MRQLKNLTEEQILEKIENVVNVIAYGYVFGYYDIDDIKQEARIEAIKCLKDYDENLPLENFLCVHLRNRLNNLIRNKYHRNDPPCKQCHAQINGYTQHPNGKHCQKYLAWKNRNANKAGLVCPLDISNIDDTLEKNTKKKDETVSNLVKEEIFNLIDLKLPATMRADYLKMKAGITIPKKRRNQIIKTIQGFLTKDEICDVISSDED